MRSALVCRPWMLALSRWTWTLIRGTPSDTFHKTHPWTPRNWGSGPTGKAYWSSTRPRKVASLGCCILLSHLDLQYWNRFQHKCKVPILLDCEIVRRGKHNWDMSRSYAWQISATLLFHCCPGLPWHAIFAIGILQGNRCRQMSPCASCASCAHFPQLH